MTEVSERYARLSADFAAKIAAVPADRWGSPSPCDDWTARGVVEHVVSTQGLFLGFVGRELGDIPNVADDPLGAWNAARAVVLADLEDPERAGVTFEGGMGTMSFEEGVDRFLNFDLVVHGWDLAHATDLDENIDFDDVERVQAAAEKFGDAMRGPNAFGPKVEPPPGADAQDRMLSFLGRRV